MKTTLAGHLKCFSCTIISLSESEDSLLKRYQMYGAYTPQQTALQCPLSLFMICCSGTRDDDDVDDVVVAIGRTPSLQAVIWSYSRDVKYRPTCIANQNALKSQFSSLSLWTVLEIDSRSMRK
jgi:hypothetical protein